MGIRRITYALGGSFVALVLVIGMITLVADSTTPATSTLGIYGHYTINVYDSDGNLKVSAQTDNAPTHLFKDCLFDGFFGTNNAVGTCGITTGVATFAIGDGGEIAPSDVDDDLGFNYLNSGTAVVVNDGGASSTVGETTIVWDNIAAPITILQSDLDASALSVTTFGDGTDLLPCSDVDGDGAIECFIDEVGLFDDDGELISHATFTPSALVNNGDTVDVTLTITLKE